MELAKKDKVPYIKLFPADCELYLKTFVNFWYTLYMIPFRFVFNQTTLKYELEESHLRQVKVVI